MNTEKLTNASLEALHTAQGIALRRDHAEVDVDHLFLALLEAPDSIAVRVLDKCGASKDAVSKMIESELGKRRKGHLPHQDPTKVYFTLILSKLFVAAEDRAEKMKDEFVSIEHLLLQMALIEETGAHRILKALDLGEKTLLKAIKAVRGNQKVTNKSPEATYEALSKYGADLVELCRKGKLEPVIGRDEEIRRVIRILSRKTKNNPVLIGQPGVGKTAIVEGIAARIVAGDVPAWLADHSLFSLDLGALVSGAKYRGEFEERLKAVLSEVQAAEGKILLFIDEIHTLVGSGRVEGSSQDAANMLKPMLARGELHCIGATTLDEYRRHVEKDKALERRFQPVTVGEPTVDDTISILRGLKERFEIHHGVRIHDRALVAATRLSSRYISDRFLPDKAIDLVDEACALVRTEIDSRPAELDAARRRIMQLEIERTALRTEEDDASKKRLHLIEQEISALEPEAVAMEARWSAERAQIEEVRRIRSEIELVKSDIEHQERVYDLNKAAELKYGVLPSLEKRLKEAEGRGFDDKDRLLREAVSEEEIAQIVSRWTGVDVTRLIESARDKLLKLDQILHRRVIGQDTAVQAVADAILRARSGIANPGRPVGSFLFLGPTGVGKTELAKTLAEALFDSEQALIRFDMTEYMEKHAVSRLLGAPPGYVGYEDAGQLTEAVRRRPYAVLLFDEVEKAHPDVFNVFLQILDDGRATDSQGRVVDFKNTVVILTSNLGSQALLEGIDAEGNISEEAKGAVQDALRATFRPEFLNRVDDVVLFQPLSMAEIVEIAQILVERIDRRLSEQGIRLQLSEEALQHIATEAYDPLYGARPLARYLQRQLETRIGRAIVQGEYKEGTKLDVDVKGGEFTITAAGGDPAPALAPAPDR